MNCERFQNSLQNSLDGLPENLSPDVLRHVASCSDCRALQAASQRFEAGVLLLQSSRISSRLPDQIVKQILSERIISIRRQRMRWVVGVLAASIALALTATAVAPRLFNARGKQSIDPDMMAIKPNPIEKESTANPSTPNRVSEAGLAVASLSNLAKEETLKQTRLFMPVATATLPFENLSVPQPFQAPADSLREAGKGVSEGLQPVTNSARRAWDLFLREVPPMDTSGKTNF
jgi:hypothetical protein